MSKGHWAYADEILKDVTAGKYLREDEAFQIQVAQVHAILAVAQQLYLIREIMELNAGIVSEDQAG